MRSYGAAFGLDVCPLARLAGVSYLAASRLALCGGHSIVTLTCREVVSLNAKVSPALKPSTCVLKRSSYCFQPQQIKVYAWGFLAKYLIHLSKKKGIYNGKIVAGSNECLPLTLTLYADLALHCISAVEFLDHASFLVCS